MGQRICLATRRRKVCYETEEIALIAIEDVAGPGHRRRHGKGGRKPVRAYPCGDHWHITSWPTPAGPKR